MKSMVGKVGKVEPVHKVWLSKKEAMAYLGCSSDFLDNIRNKALVSFAQVGKKVWYDLKSINRFIEKHRVV